MQSYDSEIAELYRSGLSAKQVAEKVGISFQAVYNSLKRSNTPLHNDTRMSCRESLSEYRCAQCGKIMYIPMPTEWVYKKTFSSGKREYYCSYTCYRKVVN